MSIDFVVHNEISNEYKKKLTESGAHRLSLGTFDLFHVGHLNLLRRAKTQCDYLIVGVHLNAKHKKKETFISLD